MSKLSEILEQLRALNDASARDGHSEHFIEVLQGQSEIILGGNREGLLWLALQCAELASKGVAGSHYHLDESSMADRADIPLVLRVSEAPWARAIGPEA